MQLCRRGFESRLRHKVVRKKNHPSHAIRCTTKINLSACIENKTKKYINYLFQTRALHIRRLLLYHLSQTDFHGLFYMVYLLQADIFCLQISKLGSFHEKNPRTIGIEIGRERGGCRKKNCATEKKNSEGEEEEDDFCLKQESRFPFLTFCVFSLPHCHTFFNWVNLAMVSTFG